MSARWSYRTRNRRNWLSQATERPVRPQDPAATRASSKIIVEQFGQPRASERDLSLRQIEPRRAICGADRERTSRHANWGIQIYGRPRQSEALRDPVINICIVG